jgi:hypothetical protein
MNAYHESNESKKHPQTLVKSSLIPTFTLRNFSISYLGFSVLVFVPLVQSQGTGSIFSRKSLEKISTLFPLTSSLFPIPSALPKTGNLKKNTSSPPFPSADCIGKTVPLVLWLLKFYFKGGSPPSLRSPPSLLQRT